jgi:hypothetical protein
VCVWEKEDEVMEALEDGWSKDYNPTLGLSAKPAAFTDSNAGFFRENGGALCALRWPVVLLGTPRPLIGPS